jgi:purine-nucleoside phosphorylase
VTYERIEAAAAIIADRTGRPHHPLAVILGSGLGDYAASLPGAIEIPYRDIPGWPVPTVEGHHGAVYSVEGPLLVLSGRAHLYEGWDLSDVVFGVRVAIAAGARTVVLTNAAGGVTAGLHPGDLVLISDHLNLTGRNPLAGPNDPRLGPRFPDLTDLYARELRDRTRAVAAEIGITLGQGVYAWFLGPSYETPAEVRMAGVLGADLVGMSTVPEAIAARHMGADVLGISLVTNLAAGISPTPLTHEEVQETAAAAKDRFTRLLDRLLPVLAGAPGSVR